MNLSLTIAWLLLLQQPAAPQVAATPDSTPSSTAGMSKLGRAVFDYLTMAGMSAADFKPLTQDERNKLYLKSLINPVLYLKGALSGAIDLGNHKPPEWELGASGYGKRTANILGQYGIQRTVTFGLSSLLREDNRYFGSGQKGIWRRTAYAFGGSFLARHDDGRRYPSVSLIAGFAAGAFISRSWQPPSTGSAGDGAISFGLSICYNALAAVAKEFLPDVVRPIVRRRNRPAPVEAPASPVLR